MAHSWQPDRSQGVFETLLVLDGRPVELEAHLARLEASLTELFPDHDPPSLDVPSHMHPYEALSDGTSARDCVGALRITVAPEADAELAARIEEREFPPGAFISLYETNAPRRTIALESQTLPGGLGAHKWADRSLLDDAQDRFPDDALPVIVDADGAVLEAARANVFAVRDGALFTPPTDGRILPGITRMRVLEIAGALGIERHETSLARDDLLTADEVFLTGSVRGVERAGALDGIELSGRGEVGAAIATELRQRWNNVPVG